ncbi:hypothetical protein A2U01_0096717, partial [Trifolium medium]|nr:hypothetical protein [Trifolium medium]
VKKYVEVSKKKLVIAEGVGFWKKKSQSHAFNLALSNFVLKV